MCEGLGFPASLFHGGVCVCVCALIKSINCHKERKEWCTHSNSALQLIVCSAVPDSSRTLRQVPQPVPGFPAPATTHYALPRPLSPSCCGLALGQSSRYCAHYWYLHTCPSSSTRNLV